MQAIAVFLALALFGCSEGEESGPSSAGETPSPVTRGKGEIPLGPYRCEFRPPVATVNKFRIEILPGARYEVTSTRGKPIAPGGGSVGEYTFFPATGGMNFETGPFAQATVMYDDLGEGRAKFSMLLLGQENEQVTITCIGGSSA